MLKCIIERERENEGKEEKKTIELGNEVGGEKEKKERLQREAKFWQSWPAVISKEMVE